MQTRERYWEGLYWDGFDPAAVGAVPLLEASSADDGINDMLQQVRTVLQSKGKDPGDFFLTIEEFGTGTTGTATAAHRARNGVAVCRLWHMNVFKGARDSGTADPAEQNIDVHFRVEEPEAHGDQKEAPQGPNNNSNSNSNDHDNATSCSAIVSPASKFAFLCTKSWDETEAEFSSQQLQ